jgi:hypothetical protein
MPGDLLPESDLELQKAMASGEGQILPLYRFDTYLFERRGNGYNMVDLKQITWFDKYLSNAPLLLDETLCSQATPPTIQKNEAWVVDLIEAVWLPMHAHANFADMEVIKGISKGLLKLDRDRNTVLAFHLDRMIVQSFPNLNYAPRIIGDAFVDHTTRGTEKSYCNSTLFIPDTPIYLRPNMPFKFIYSPCEKLIEELFNDDDVICFEQRWGLRLTLRGRLFRPIYESLAR